MSPELWSVPRDEVSVPLRPPPRSDRIGDGHYIYWASLYAAASLTIALACAIADDVYRRIWRSDPCRSR